jgi:hypothetical protein
MPTPNKDENDRIIELLAKLLAMKMHSMGATQGQIARAAGKAKSWVNSVVRGVPRYPERDE